MLQRTRYLNAQNTFSELLQMGVVPIVNENDTVSVSVRTQTHDTRLTDCGRKSDSVTTIHSLPFPPPLSTQISSFFSQMSGACESSGSVPFLCLLTIIDIQIIPDAIQTLHPSESSEIYARSANKSPPLRLGHP
jgi:hypothetical protein